LPTPQEYEQLVCNHTREEVLERAWAALSTVRFPGIVTKARVRGALPLFEVTPSIDVLDRTGVRIQTVTCPRPERIHAGDKVTFELNANQRAPEVEGTITSSPRLTDEEHDKACKLKDSFWMVAQSRCARNRLPAETQITIFDITFGATQAFGRRFELACGGEIYWVLIGRGNNELKTGRCTVKLRADFGSLPQINQAHFLIKQFEKKVRQPFSLPRADPKSGTVNCRLYKKTTSPADGRSLTDSVAGNGEMLPPVPG
jgi:hypothetical protein